MPLNRLENILIGVDLKEGYSRLTKRERILSIFIILKDTKMKKLQNYTESIVKM